MTHVAPPPSASNNEPPKMHEGAKKKVDLKTKEDERRIMLSQVRKPPVARPHTPLIAIREEAPQAAFVAHSILDVKKMAERTLAKPMTSPALVQEVRSLVKLASKGIEQGNNIIDPAVMKTLIKHLTALSRKEAFAILGSVKQENQIGILASVTNMTRAIFQLTPNGAAATNQVLKSLERVLEGREKLIEFLQKGAPERQILQLLALHPTCFDALVASCKTETLSPAAQAQVARLENIIGKAHDLLDFPPDIFTQEPAHPPSFTKLIHNTEREKEERESIYFVCKHILRPQLPIDKIPAADRFLKVHDQVVEMMEATKEKTLERALSITASLTQQEPKIADVILAKLAKKDPTCEKVVTLFAKWTKLCAALKEGNIQEIEKYILPLFKAGALPLLRPLLAKISVGDVRATVQANFALCQKILAIPHLLNPKTAAHGLSLCNEIMQSGPLVHPHFKSYFESLTHDKNLLQLYAVIEQDKEINGNDTAALKAFSGANMLVRYAYSHDIGSFQRKLRSLCKEAANPQVRLQAIHAVYITLIIPSETPARQARLQACLPYFNQ